METPCQSCELRTVNCHSCCSKYKAYREKVDALREARNQNIVIESYTAEEIHKARKHKHRRKHYG